MHYTTVTEVTEQLIEEHMQAAIHAQNIEGKAFFLNQARGAKTLWSELMHKVIMLEMSLDKINEKRKYTNEKERIFSEMLDMNRVFPI